MKEQEEDQQQRAIMAVEYLIVGFTMGVAYCTVRELLLMKNDMRFLRRINRFKAAWQNYKADLPEEEDKHA